jgi:hypothetical protein
VTPISALPVDSTSVPFKVRDCGEEKLIFSEDTGKAERWQLA